MVGSELFEGGGLWGDVGYSSECVLVVVDGGLGCDHESFG